MGLALIFSLRRRDYNPSSCKATATLVNATVLFLKLKIMFTDGDNYRASFWKFQIQSITTLQAQEFKNTLQNLRLLNSKLDQASKMSYLGVHGIRSLKWLNSSKGNRWNGVNFYLKITRFGVCSSRGWAW